MKNKEDKMVYYKKCFPFIIYEQFRSVILLDKKCPKGDDSVDY